MGAGDHLTVVPDNAEVRADGGTEETVYVVIGVNRWPEDGFEVIRAFADEARAEEYADSDRPGEDAEYGWRRYYATEVPYDNRE